MVLLAVATNAAEIETFDETFGDWGLVAASALAALFCVIRAALVGATAAERAGWGAAGLAFAAWAVAVQGAWSGTSPEPAGAIGVVACPALAASLILIAGSSLGRVGYRLAFDSLVVGLGAASLLALITFDEPVATALSTTAADAYRAGSGLLVATGLGVAAAAAWKPGGRLTRQAVAAIATAIAIAVGSSQAAVDSEVLGFVVKAVVTGAALTFAWTAYERPNRAEHRDEDRLPVLVVTIAATVAAVGVLVAAAAQRSVPDAAIVTAALAVAALLGRYAATSARLRDALAQIRGRSFFDQSTGLGNRRKLIADLGSAARRLPEEGPLLLGVYDLFGLRAYRETFGNLAGDAMLKRLIRRAAAGVSGSGEVYRTGDAELAVLARVGRGGGGSSRQRGDCGPLRPRRRLHDRGNRGPGRASRRYKRRRAGSAAHAAAPARAPPRVHRGPRRPGAQGHRAARGAGGAAHGLADAAW